MMTTTTSTITKATTNATAATAHATVQQAISSFITDNLLLGKKIDVAGTPSFLEAGVIDSTGVLELVQFLEETWGFAVLDDEIVPENLDSLESLVRFVGKKTRLTAQPLPTITQPVPAPTTLSTPPPPTLPTATSSTKPPVSVPAPVALGQG